MDMKTILLLFLSVIGANILRAEAIELDGAKPCQGGSAAQDAGATANAEPCWKSDVRAEGSAATNPAPKPGAIHADIALHDGSVLRCAIPARSLPFTTAFGQKVDIRLGSIDKVVAGAGEGNVVVHFRNGDRLSGSVGVESFKVRTAFGPLTLPLPIIQSIKFQSPRAAVAGLLYWNTFDSEAATQKPMIGPRTELNAGRFISGVKGKALHTGGSHDVLSFRMPPNAFQPKGCIEFWAKLDVEGDVIPAGSHPRFFWLSRPNSTGGIRIDYSPNNGVGAGGLTAIFNNISLGSSTFGGQNTYSSILGSDYAGWHHYALVWNEKGIETGTADKPSVALYLNGKLVSREIHVPGPLSVESITRHETLFLMSTYLYNGVSKMPYAIDELKIWNYDKTEFEYD